MRKLILLLALNSCGSINNVEKQYVHYFDEFKSLCIKHKKPCKLINITIKNVGLKELSKEKNAVGLTTYAPIGTLQETLIEVRSHSLLGIPFTEAEIKFITFHELFHASLYARHVDGENELMSKRKPQTEFIDENIDSIIEDAFFGL